MIKPEASRSLKPPPAESRTSAEKSPVQPESRETGETAPPSKYRIIQEVGEHPFGPNARAQELEIEKRYYAGDPHAHYWRYREALVNRLQGAEVLAIDGLTPSSEVYARATQLGDPKHYYEDQIWWHLPDAPSEINPQGKLKILRADYIKAENFLPAGFVGDQTGFKKEVAGLSDQWRGESNFALSLNHYATAGFIATALGVGAQKMIEKKQRNLQPRDKPAKFTRREFLKAGITIGGVSALAHILASFNIQIGMIGKGASAANSRETQELLVNIAEIIKPRLFKQDWVDFRTALLTAKLEDSLEYLEMPEETQAVNLTGYAHMWEAKDITENLAERQKILRKFLMAMIETIERICDQYPEVIDRDAARNYLLDYLAKVEVVEVTDPKLTDPENKLSLPEAVAKSMEQIASFQSPQLEEIFQEFR